MEIRPPEMNPLTSADVKPGIQGRHPSYCEFIFYGYDQLPTQHPPGRARMCADVVLDIDYAVEWRLIVILNFEVIPKGPRPLSYLVF